MYKWIEQRIPWILLIVVSGISVYFWLSMVGTATFSAYTIFPILGVLAWEIMWVQCIIRAATIVGFRRSKSRYFKPFSERAVLFLILLHPAIFLVQRLVDSGQLPPQSYLSYVGTDYGWAVMLGITGLAVFLLYDFFKLFQKSPARYWFYHYVSLLQAGAMVAIFVHGLAIGSLMHTGFLYVWILLGAILAPCLTLYVIAEFQSGTHQPKPR